MRGLTASSLSGTIAARNAAASHELEPCTAAHLAMGRRSLVDSNSVVKPWESCPSLATDALSSAMPAASMTAASRDPLLRAGWLPRSCVRSPAADEQP